LERNTFFSLIFLLSVQFWDSDFQRLFFFVLPYSLHNKELGSMILALMVSLLCAPDNQAEQLCALELENLQLRHGLEEAVARSKEKESHAQQ
jgi:hypothetical protein